MIAAGAPTEIMPHNWRLRTVICCREAARALSEVASLAMELDCQACGACCAYDREWPIVEPTDDVPPELVERGAMRFRGGRCVALQGEVGGCVGCTIYERRPAVCRDCAPGSISCLIARRHHGLPIPQERSSLDDLMVSGPRSRLR